MQKPIAAAVIAAAVIASLFAAPAQAQNFINILTGATTGVYFPLGNALSGIYARALPETKVTVQSTKASVENLNLIQAGRGEIAFTLGDALSDAWKGNEDAGYKTKLDKLRVVAPLYSNYIQIVVSAESGIQSIDDLKGKRLSVGPAKSGTELNARAVLAAAGLSYADLGKIEYLPFGQSVELMKNRQLDGTLISSGLGVAAIRDLATSQAIRLLPIPPAVAAKITDAAYLPADIPAGVYPGMTEAIPGVRVQNYLVTSSALPEELIYTLTKELYENLHHMVAASAAAKEIDIETASYPAPAPLHPGAIKYLHEKHLHNKTTAQ